MQALRPLSRRYPVEPGTQGVIRARAGEQASREGAVIEPGSPDQNRKTPPAVDLANRPLGVVRELCCGVHLGGIGDVDQVMRDAPALLLRQLVGADVEAAVYRSRVAVDDLAPVAFGERQAEGTLAGGGRPQNGQNEWAHLRI